MPEHYEKVEQLNRQIGIVCAEHRLAIDEWQLSYIAHLIARYSGQSILTIGSFVQCTDPGQLNNRELHAIGDECLLLCGLCPHSIEGHGYSVDYVSGFGKHCYRQLSERITGAPVPIYEWLANSYESLINVLQTVADDAAPANVSPLHYAEAWRDSRARSGYSALQAFTGGKACLPLDMRGTSTVH